MSKILLRLKYGLILVVLLVMIACNSTKNASTEAAQIEDTKSNTGENHRLIVSFFSPGNGIDHKMKKKFEEFLSVSYPKVQYASNRWGKEGEVTYLTC
ncbi:MAG: hypothetical protein COA71_07505 [SAR86 cluster bacterium]|uniref:Uncharacterized protein n=1 Tax=SAR86 cluster bacterium TaxID=2030880 RepID=A0A2A5CEB2_9GAMM|nr:MAG: hypothetical protein COA71_07505 [SAR86 cluster bacterium]